MLMRIQKRFFGVNILPFLLLGGLMAYKFIFVPYRISNVGAEPPALSEEQVKLANEYRRRPQPATRLHGVFAQEGLFYGDAYVAELRFQGRDRIHVSVLLNDRYSYSGSATYRFHGSVMSFSNVSGDKVLFPVEGAPVTVSCDGQSITLHTPERPDLHLRHVGHGIGSPIQPPSAEGIGWGKPSRSSGLMPTEGKSGVFGDPPVDLSIKPIGQAAPEFVSQSGVAV